MTSTVRGCPCPVAGRSLRHPAFAHSMLTALRHPACAGQQRRLSGHGQPLTDSSESHKSPRRKPGDSGFECRPTCHAFPGRAQRPGVPGLPSGAFCQTFARRGGLGQNQPPGRMPILRPYAGRQDGGLNASGRSPPRKNGLDGHVFRVASPTTSRPRDGRTVPACVMPRCRASRPCWLQSPRAGRSRHPRR